MSKADSKAIVRDYEVGDEKDIVNLLAINWEHLKGLERLNYWKWEYGLASAQALVKVAVHEGRIIGHYSFLPLGMECGGQTIAGAKAEGGIVHPDYRGVNGRRFLPENENRTIYNILITESFKAAQRKGIKLLWGCPNKLALRGQVRAGYVNMIIPISSFLLPLDIRKTMRLLFSNISRTTGLKGITTFSPERTIRMLGASKYSGIAKGDVGDIEIVEGTNRIGTLWQRFIIENDCVTIQRNEEYLKRRICDNPIIPHKAIMAFRRNEPTAYVAFAIVRGRKVCEGRIVDMVGLRGHEHDLRLLISRAVHSIKEARAHLVTTWLIKNKHSAAYRKILSDTGFIELPTRNIDMLVRGYDLPEDYITRPDNWFITAAFSEGVS